MTDRTADFFVCDDVLVSMNGKLTLLGIYGTAIVIPSDPTTVGQLFVLFQIGSPITKPFKQLRLQISLPGEQSPRTLDVPLQSIVSTTGPFYSAPPGQSKLTVRFAFSLAQVVLKPGAMEMKVIHEEGEIYAGKQLIVTAAQAPQLLSPSLSS
jgi:hypothetical protein